MSSSPLPVRPCLTLLLAIAVVATGLLIPSASPAAATSPIASAAVPADCDTDPELCPPPGLLNEQLLSDPTSFFYATAEQKAALRGFESQAVANTLADHQLPAADAQRVMSWGRDEALAELWALLVQAISTDPGRADRAAEGRRGLDGTDDDSARPEKPGSTAAGSTSSGPGVSAPPPPARSPLNLSASSTASTRAPCSRSTT